MHPNVYKNIFLVNFKPTKLGKFFCTSSIIPGIFLKKSVQLYKGSIFNKFQITKYNKGYRFGEFNVTRKPFSFKQKKSKR